MRPDVLLEVVLPAEALVTEWTWEGPCSAVDATVTGEFLVAGEGFTTALVVTSEGPLSCVYSHMSLQLPLITEG